MNTKNGNPSTDSVTSYLVSSSEGSGFYSPDGFSKYSERWQLKQNGELKPGERIYGYAQALEHIEEIKQHVYQGKKHNEKAVFTIHINTMVTTVIVQ